MTLTHRPLSLDQVILLSDFNGRLARGVAKGVLGTDNRVGAYTPHAREDKGGQLLRELMEEFGLFAPQTFFQPAKHGGDRKGFGGATYVMEKRSKAELERLGMDAQPPALIDMVLCPERWRSSAVSARVRWGPTMYRHGHKTDHGMVEVGWRFRCRKTPPAPPKKDFSVLRSPESGGDSEAKEIFDAAAAAILGDRVEVLAGGADAAAGGVAAVAGTMAGAAAAMTREMAGAVPGAVEPTVSDLYSGLLLVLALSPQHCRHLHRIARTRKRQLAACSSTEVFVRPFHWKWQLGATAASCGRVHARARLGPLRLG